MGFDDKLILQIFTGLLVIILTIVILILRSKRIGRKAVLLTGVCDSGKTLLFARLAHSKFIHTYTSMKENLAYYRNEKGMLQLIDVPGNERVRNRYLDEYKSSARALVFVIDSCSIQKEIKDVAEYLFNLLTDKTIINNCKNILILCNKQDVPMAKDAGVIKSLLEKEINTVRETKASQLLSTDENSSDNRIKLGSTGLDFTFDQLLPKVEFAESFAIDKEDIGPNLVELKKWLRAVSG
ncbi:signal recognition particle receptor subunit beta [Halyomorpha halys]|uniref:signal recognition particle receptor subunit beta n=1 Tax=Halyomorpha halys TaxID=286706 RepID=UPI0006D4E418|nr:signal recognition particle receptor subunit beta [Halyomorpha halys]